MVKTDGNQKQEPKKPVSTIKTGKVEAGAQSNYSQYRVVSNSASKVYSSAKSVRIIKRVISN